MSSANPGIPVGLVLGSSQGGWAHAPFRIAEGVGKSQFAVRRIQPVHTPCLCTPISTSHFGRRSIDFERAADRPKKVAFPQRAPATNGNGCNPLPWRRPTTFDLRLTHPTLRSASPPQKWTDIPGAPDDPNDAALLLLHLGVRSSGTAALSCCKGPMTSRIGSRVLDKHLSLRPLTTRSLSMRRRAELLLFEYGAQKTARPLPANHHCSAEKRAPATVRKGAEKVLESNGMLHMEYMRSTQIVWSTEFGVQELVLHNTKYSPQHLPCMGCLPTEATCYSVQYGVHMRIQVHLLGCFHGNYVVLLPSTRYPPQPGLGRKVAPAFCEAVKQSRQHPRSTRRTRPR